MKRHDTDALAGIQYAGVAGASGDCQDAVLRLIQYGDQVTRACILSSAGDHCLLLSIGPGDLIAVKSGFGSGYLGEGPHAFSYVLQVLEAHGAEIEEYEVSHNLIDRLDNSALTASDISSLEAARPVRPRRWPTYIFEVHFEEQRDGTLWRDFPPVIPLTVIDSRIIDLALFFWQNPDEKLLTGYRRLEDLVRKRTGVEEHGARLFSQAFLGPTAKLGWNNIDTGEQAGRSSLFVGAFSAYRNPRAHRELANNSNNQLVEFLLLNHLYILERTSIERACEVKT